MCVSHGCGASDSLVHQLTGMLRRSLCEVLTGALLGFMARSPAVPRCRCRRLVRCDDCGDDATSGVVAVAAVGTTAAIAVAHRHFFVTVTPTLSTMR